MWAPLQERPFKSTVSASISHPVGCLLPYYIAFLPPLALHWALRQCVSKLCSTLTSNYCSVLLQIAREMPIRPALMASVSNQSTEDRVGPHMVETAIWPASGTLADKVQDRDGGESNLSLSFREIVIKEGPSIGVAQNSIENVLTTY